MNNLKIENNKINEYYEKIKKFNFNFIDKIKDNDMDVYKKDYAMLLMLSLINFSSSSKMTKKQLENKDKFIEKMISNGSIVSELMSINNKFLYINLNENQRIIFEKSKRNFRSKEKYHKNKLKI